MLNLESTDSYYKQQQQIAAATVASSSKLWRRMDDDFDASWMRIAPDMLETVQLGRTAAAVSSLGVTSLVLKETGQVAPAQASVNAFKFVETAPDGRSMASLLDESVVQAKTAVASGVDIRGSLFIAEKWLAGMLMTVIADTGRGVVGADMASRPKVGGYVRMLNPPSCPRCVILAGKWFRWNEGFQRHPRCDCRHVPSAGENWAKSEGFVSDPYEYFYSRSQSEQDRVWGASNARAIRDGADIYRVENIRLRGLATAKGNLRYGTPSRYTVDDIYRTAKTRAEAIKLMEREGYLTGPQTAGGNIVGRYRERFSVPISRPVVPGSARERVLKARATGVRDPLDRATMTAAERRLFDANYRLEYARRNGTLPRSIGMNSADAAANGSGIKATARDIARLEAELGSQVSKINDKTSSMFRLANELGLTDGRSDIVFDRIYQQMSNQFRQSTRARRAR